MEWLVVSEERFYEMYRQHIQQRNYAYVNWYVDAFNNLNMFIFTDYSCGYFYQCNAKEIPERLKPLIARQGEFFGFKEDNKTTQTNLPKYQELRTTNTILQY